MKKCVFNICLAICMGALGSCSRDNEIAEEIFDHATQLGLIKKGMIATVHPINESLTAVSFKSPNYDIATTTLLVDPRTKQIVLWANHLNNGNEFLVIANKRAELNVSVLRADQREAVKVIRSIKSPDGSVKEVVYGDDGEITFRTGN